MDAQTLLLEALDARWEQYREKIKICRGEYSEESVHDLRVAARRLLAIPLRRQTMAGGRH